MGTEQQSLASKVLLALLSKPWGSIQSCIDAEATNDNIIRVAKEYGVELPAYDLIARVGVSEAHRLTNSRRTA